MGNVRSPGAIAETVRDLLDRAVTGEIGMKVAEELAASQNYAQRGERAALADLALAIAREAHQGDAWEGYLGERIVYSALRGAPITSADPEAVRLSGMTAAHCLAVATLVLYEVGHTGVYRWACTVADETLAMPLDDVTRGALEFHYGTLHLDPYFATRDLNWYRLGIETWRSAATDLDPEEAYSPGVGQEDGLPSPAEALRLAELHLSKGSQLGRGMTRRDALKALVQSIESRRNLDLPIEHERLVGICDEALEALREWPDPLREQLVRAVRTRALQELGRVAEQDDLAVTSPAEMLEQMGPVVARDRALVQLSSLARMDLGAALTFAVEARPLFSPEIDEAAWEKLRGLELHIVAAIGTSAAKLADYLADPQGVLRTIDEDCPEEHHRAACLVALASQSSELNAERVGLQLLKLVSEGSPSFAALFRDSLYRLRAMLYLGLGADAANAGDWRTSSETYYQSLRLVLDLDLASASELILARLLDVVSHLDGNAAGVLASSLEGIAPSVDRRCRLNARRMLTAVGSAALRAAQGGETKTIALQWMGELAKGRKTRAWLKTPRPLELSDDARRLLATIREKERLLGAGSTPQSDEWDFDAQLLLAARARKPSAAGGKDDRDQLSRLEQQFDRMLVEARLAALIELDSPPTEEDVVRKAIDPESVVLDLHCVEDEKGALTVCLAYTAEDVVVFAVDDKSEPFRALRTDDSRQSVDVSGLGLYVANARSLLLKPSGLMSLDREARRVYEKGLLKFLGNGVEYLETLRRTKGKKHLCIVPHGPLHLFPFHALGAMDRPLAEDWIVTYLPDLSYLTLRQPQAAAAHRRTAAMGISYRGHPFLAELATSESETKAVAKAMASVPLLNGHVTKARVLEALRQSASVHLSCHGSYRAEAPYYQCLYLAGDDLEGRLLAYELMNEDLSKLSVVTLSACETALTAFDEADDLRGFQASLLQAGVGTIVDTLWEVNSDATPVFFGTFYERLRSGATKLRAFDEARRETRRQFPSYRDWAAFRFTGEWRETPGSPERLV